MTEFGLNYYLDHFTLASVLDILLVTLLLYTGFMLVRGTRAVQLLRGLIVLAVMFVALNSFLRLPAFGWVVSSVLPAVLVAIPVIFQPELRRALEQLGRAGGLLRTFRREHHDELLEALATASRRLSNRRHGALMVIERDTGLQEYIDTGTLLDARPSAELLAAIFYKDVDLHDGAVIIRNGRIVAAGCVMPLSTSLISDRKMGLRHRAALGISEVSDAIALVVSEETGYISIAHNGRILRRQDPDRLDAILQVFMQNPRQSSAA